LVMEEFPLPRKIGTPPTEGREETISTRRDGLVRGRGVGGGAPRLKKIKSVTGEWGQGAEVVNACKSE
jgi:hypothetical protein